MRRYAADHLENSGLKDAESWASPVILRPSLVTGA